MAVILSPMVRQIAVYKFFLTSPSSSFSYGDWGLTTEHSGFGMFTSMATFERALCRPASYTSANIATLATVNSQTRVTVKNCCQSGPSLVKTATRPRFLDNVTSDNKRLHWPDNHA